MILFYRHYNYTLIKNCRIFCYQPSHNISLKRTFTVLLFPHLNFNIKKKFYLTIVQQSSFSKRFTGNKPMGHAKKILDSINKPKLPPESCLIPTPPPYSISNQVAKSVIKEEAFTEMSFPLEGGITFEHQGPSPQNPWIGLNVKAETSPKINQALKTTVSFSQVKGPLPNGSNAAQISSQISLALYSEPITRPYSTFRAHTPLAITSTNESLTNNPAKMLHRKKKSVVIQHTEVVEDTCVKPGCKNKLCNELCDDLAEPSKSIGHLTHSDRDGLDVQKLSNGDVNGDVNSPQFIRTYKNPHETCGDSIDPVADIEKTKVLKKIFQNIYDDNAT